MAPSNWSTREDLTRATSRHLTRWLEDGRLWNQLEVWGSFVKTGSSARYGELVVTADKSGEITCYLEDVTDLWTKLTDPGDDDGA